MDAVIPMSRIQQRGRQICSETSKRKYTADVKSSNTKNMREVAKTVKLYVADDGKEFISESDCEKYEEELAKMSNVKYFEVWYNPDLTETGSYRSFMCVAVFCIEKIHRAILDQWLIKNKGISFVGCGVQGYGIKMHCCVSECTAERFVNAQDKQKWFLSPTEIDGFPTKQDYYMM